MSSTSRTAQSLKNIFSGIGSQLFLTIISFYTTRIIKLSLGFEYLGLNGVFGNVISLLSLTELGIGTAIVFALYKPLAENDTELICSLMRFYRNAYRIIAAVVFSIGLLLLPFLKLFVHTTLSMDYVRISFLLFVVNSALSYLLSYKRNLIYADQKNYIITLYSLTFSFVSKIGQLVVFSITKNYLLYLCVTIVCTVGLNLLLSWKADQMYPFLNKTDVSPLSSDIKSMLITKVKAVFLHSIGSKVVFATDNILIAYFLGVATVGKYTAYMTIVTFISSLTQQFLSGITSSVGNYIVEHNTQERYDLFRKIEFASTILSIFSCVCLAVLLNPFISWWLGSDTLLSQETVYLLVLSNWIIFIRRPVYTVKSAAGLFEQDKYAPLVESVINLLASCVLVQFIGLPGIILGTIIGEVAVPLWVGARVIYTHLFNRKSYEFLLRVIMYLLITVALTAGIQYVNSKLYVYNDTVTLLLYFVTAIAVCSVVELLLFFKSPYSKYFIDVFFKRKHAAA